MNSIDKQIKIVSAGQEAPATISLIGEEPLSIRVQGMPYAVVMRTPGDEKAHVAGFCLGEGIVDHPGDITNIAFCDGEDTNVVTVTLTADRRSRIAEHLDRRTYISQTSCGICGKSIVDDLVQALSPVSDGDPLDNRGALDRLIHLGDDQPLRAKTRAAHAAAIYDDGMRRLSLAEDVGRHNALDKAIGSGLDQGVDLSQCLAFLSGRVSYEMAIKAARVGLQVLGSVSGPTVLGVRLLDRLGVTLAAFIRPPRFTVYTHPQRVLVKGQPLQGLPPFEVDD